MGKESNVHKDRMCKSCGEAIYTTANGLEEHASICKRMVGAGLVLPGAVARPKLEIIRLDEP